MATKRIEKPGVSRGDWDVQSKGQSKRCRFALLASIAFLGSCGSSNEERIKDAVRQQLRDPDSAQFSNLDILPFPDSGFTMCGEVNARNAFGGYAGAQRFYGSVLPGGGVMAVIVPEGSPTYCDVYRQADREREASERETAGRTAP